MLAKLAISLPVFSKKKKKYHMVVKIRTMLLGNATLKLKTSNYDTVSV